MIQDKDGKTAAAPSTMPSDRHFRNAWVFNEDASAITNAINITALKAAWDEDVLGTSPYK